jgi:transposase
LPRETVPLHPLVQEPRQHVRRASYEQKAQGFERFMKRPQDSGISPADILVVMEATGSYWVALATVVHQAGSAVSVINPAQAHNARQSTTEESTRTMDWMPRRLRTWLKLSFPLGFPPPPQIYYELQQRLAQRVSFLELRTHSLNQLHALAVSPIVVAAVRRRLEQPVETLNQDITELDKEILELVQVSQQVSGKHSGEGTVSAEGEVDTKWKAAIALLTSHSGDWIAVRPAGW